MATVETTNRNEAPKMRKVKNNLHLNNPAMMFAQGVESLINDPLYSPAKSDGEEINTMRRVARKQDARGNLFGVLLRQFSNL